MNKSVSTFFESSLFAFLLYSLGNSEFHDYSKLSFPVFGRWVYEGGFSLIMIEGKYNKILGDLF